MNIFEQASAYWDAHGTKMLGGLTAFFAGLQAAAALQPNLFNSTVRATIAATNAGLGVWTVKRGKYNSDQIAQKVVEKQLVEPLNNPQPEPMK